MALTKIAAGAPGWAFINLDGRYIVLNDIDGVLTDTGEVPPGMSLRDVKNAILDALPDGRAVASRKGIFTAEDFRKRAAELEQKPNASQADLALAAKLRKFAETWDNAPTKPLGGGGPG